MTIKEKKCGFCGALQSVADFVPGGVWSARDLDTRSEALNQFGLLSYMQVCQECGYSRTALEVKASSSIKNILDEPFNYDELHQRYFRSYKIECQENGLSMGGIYLLLGAVWSCDDALFKKEAKAYRLKAIDAIKSLSAKSDRIKTGDCLLLADLCRRTGKYSESMRNIDRIKNDNLPKMERKIVEFQTHLNAVKDSDCHGILEAINFGKPDNPSEKVGVAVPQSSPDDKFLGTFDIVGTFAVKDFHSIIRQLKHGDQLLLCREPSNSYDINAIRVDTQTGYKLGYLPRHQNKELAELLDDGNLLYGIILLLDGYDDKFNIEIFQSNYFKSIPDLAKIDSIQQFELKISSWGTDLLQLYVDGRKNKVIKICYSIDCWASVRCNLKLKNPFGKDKIPSGVIYKVIMLSDDRFNEFVDALSGCRVNYWDSSYDVESVYDGIQWELRMKYNDGKLFKSDGSSQCPPQWQRFIEVLAEYVDPAAKEYSIIVYQQE